MRAAIDPGRLVQLGRNVLEERAQHPDRERLIDRHQNGNDRHWLSIQRRRHFAEKRPEDFRRIDEDRKIASDKNRVRKRSEDQGHDQDPESKARP